MELSGFEETPVGITKGLAIAWQEGVNLSVKGGSDFFIWFSMEDSERQLKWEVLVIYFHSYDRIKETQFVEVLNIIQKLGDHFIVADDFNAIVTSQEKSGDNEKSQQSIQNF
ncbi:hypothetical protein PIB30_093474 [Stylosanthes scabra]|uniref:RNase H type-1 domain-containing protein n=1 Tax=Stylosanthes scabra TaxID=79078 RepID=A0ABU6QVT8_9FABA|nr:hypothetical protein [Stylosanthes scabra]